MHNAQAGVTDTDDSNDWYSAVQLEEIASEAQVRPTHGKRPKALDPAALVEVLYVTGRWCSGLPGEHQWSRISHYRAVV